MFNVAKKAAMAVAAGSLALASQVHAALPAGVVTAVEDIGEDGTSLATTVLLAVVAIFAIKFLRRGL